MIGDRFPNETVGGVLAAAGTTGGTVQTIAEVANLYVLLGNAALITGGLILLGPRLLRMWKRRK